MLGFVGDKIEQWTKRCIYHIAAFNDLDWASNDPVEITLTLSYDYTS